MTPLSMDDPRLHISLARAIWAGDVTEASSKLVLDFVQNKMVPILQREGLCFCINKPTGNDAAYPKTPEESYSLGGKAEQELTATLAPGQSTGEAHTARMTTQDHMRKYESEPEPKMSKEEADAWWGKNATAEIKARLGTLHTFDIGTAMNLVKAGKKVARSGWNGKNMFVYYVPAGNWKAATQVASQVFGDTVPYNHYLAIKNPDGTVSTWAPSGSDALATDWYIVD